MPIASPCAEQYVAVPHPDPFDLDVKSLCFTSDEEQEPDDETSAEHMKAC